MEYNGLDICIDINASGHGRGYYEVDYGKLKEDLDVYLSTIETTSKKNLKKIVREYIEDNSYRYRGEFIFIRNDMEEEVYIEIY